jgi:hypothetical protein
VDFTAYRQQLLQQRQGEIALWGLVRNFSQWFFDLLRNFVLVGGLKYFAEKSGSTVLFYLHEFALVVIFFYASLTPTNGTSTCSASWRTSGSRTGSTAPSISASPPRCSWSSAGARRSSSRRSRTRRYES